MAVHVSVPELPEQAPTPQEVDRVSPSSTLPSQSLSTLSHRSAVAPSKGSQESSPQLPAVHVSVPELPEQAPTPQEVDRVSPSSTLPSQSLSTLSHRSAVAPSKGSQESSPQLPAVHVSVPELPEQAPTPQEVDRVSPSSTLPSQSLSTLSHRSAVAPSKGSQVSFPQSPSVHVSVPVLPEQAPTPQVVGRVSSSSTLPSQSSSIPLHASSAPGLIEASASSQSE